MISPYVIPGLKERKIYPQYFSRQYILDRVFKHFGCTIDDLKVKRRTRDLVQKRYILAYFLYQYSKCTYQEIAQMFAPAVRDHSSIIHGVQLIKDLIETENDEILFHVKNISL